MLSTYKVKRFQTLKNRPKFAYELEGFHRDSDIYVHMYICKIHTHEAKYGGMILTLSIGTGAIFSPP